MNTKILRISKTEFKKILHSWGTELTVKVDEIDIINKLVYKTLTIFN